MTLATFSTEKRFPTGAYLFQEGDEGTRCTWSSRGG
jgi:hypothetical protein